MSEEKELPIDKGKLGRAVDRGYAAISTGRRPLIVLGIVVALVFLIIFGPGFVLGIRDAITTPKIEKQKQEAATEKTAAEQEKISAGAAETERKAEDQKRAQSIQPRRQSAATRFDEARRQREALENDYEKNLQTPRRAPVDDRELHRRNCTDLAELLPGRRVAGCQ